MSKTAGLSRTADTALPDPSRWKALAFIALAQLMVVLDATIVNIALPSAQTDLGISDGNKQWVITASRARLWRSPPLRRPDRRPLGP